MKGRLEHELKEFDKLEEKIKDCPQYITEWYLNMKASQKTSTTCRDYINNICLYLKFIDADMNVEPEDMNMDNVTRFYLSINTKEKNGETVETSDSYKNVMWTCLHGFFDFMIKRGYIETNYIESIKKPKNNDLERINLNRVTLSKEQLQAVLNNQESVNERIFIRDRAILLLYMTTGMRKSALVQINLDDINYEKGILYITDKRKKRNEYLLTDSVIRALNAWLEVREDTPLNIDTNALFLSKRGTRLASVSAGELVQKHCEHALGFKISPHKLRASFLTLLYEETGDIEFVRRAANHATTTTTQRYINTNNKEKEQVKDIMSRNLSI